MNEKTYIDKGYRLDKNAEGFLLNKGDFRLKIDSSSTDVAYTSLVKEEYNFYGDDDEKFVVFDIGLNIGLTTLYLAQNRKVTHIYGFEPFTETFEKAEENIQLNPELAKKITVFNFGLGNRNERKSFHYNPKMHASMSTFGERFPQAGQIAEVELHRASETLQPFFAEHSESIMLKIDCEGAELQILPDLAVAGLLKKVRIVIMEWHFKTPESLIRILIQNGFTVFCNHEIVNYQGTIRAVNSENRSTKS